ncbi:hypothetical protein GOB93_19490 [Acetobacter musti]|uniref:Inosine/uridine-preferring nucleoside hydrolase domain-containing protein n=1 Tax=Acetobacter musti TaxID=864732 RepID=A0ABX0JZ53_9PROT|nr:nucleoside hydrolase [Acetobacter musti]NHN86784.1 hypothetical protein [Acetobacter musti]
MTERAKTTASASRPERRTFIKLSLATFLTGSATGGAFAQTAWTALGQPVSRIPWLQDVRRVIIDTDPGTDDLLALLMLLGSPTITTDAITVAPGNVEYAQEIRNALYLAERFGNGKVPVYRGLDHPLMGHPYPRAGFIHGRSGLGELNIPDEGLPLSKGSAATAIVNIVSEHPGEVTLLALGGLTNIALALLLDQSIATKIRGIVVVGGRYQGIGTNVSFNSMVDPEAADLVLKSGAPIVMTGDLGQDAMLGPADFDRIRSFHTKRSDIFIKSNVGRLHFEMEQRHKPGATYNDPLAAAMVIDPSIIEQFEQVHVSVELNGSETRGAYVFGATHIFTGDSVLPNVAIASQGNPARFRNVVFQALRRA